MGPQCRGGTCSLSRERAMSVMGEQAQKAEGKGQRAKNRRWDNVNTWGCLPVLLAAPMSKRTLHRGPGRAEGQ